MWGFLSVLFFKLPGNLSKSKKHDCSKIFKMEQMENGNRAVKNKPKTKTNKQ